MTEGKMLTYKGIQKVLLAKIPELRGPIERNFSYYDLKKEMPEPYPVFEDVLKQMVLQSLGAPDSDQLLDRIFAFLEEMACSQDKEVVNLLWIALLEPLVSDRGHVGSAWKYMGERTRQLATELARTRGWHEYLPPGGNGG